MNFFYFFFHLEIDPDRRLHNVFVEKVKCASVDTLFQALEAAMIFFFIFNMVYPKEISSTLQALQVLMGLPMTFGRSKKKNNGEFVFFVRFRCWWSKMNQIIYLENIHYYEKFISMIRMTKK